MVLPRFEPLLSTLTMKAHHVQWTRVVPSLLPLLATTGLTRRLSGPARHRRLLGTDSRRAGGAHWENLRDPTTAGLGPDGVHVLGDEVAVRV